MLMDEFNERACPETVILVRFYCVFTTLCRMLHAKFSYSRIRMEVWNCYQIVTYCLREWERGNEFVRIRDYVLNGAKIVHVETALIMSFKMNASPLSSLFVNAAFHSTGRENNDTAFRVFQKIFCRYGYI